MHDPANLLLSELLVSHRAPLMKTDHQFRKLIFDVLASWAERVEAIHRRQWSIVAPAGTPKRQGATPSLPS